MSGKSGRLLVMLMITELCLGGGGRFTAMGWVSLRMVLFALALIVCADLLIRQKVILPIEIMKLIVGFAVMVCLGIIVGIARGGNLNNLVEDVKPLAYFLALPFFYWSIHKEEIPAIEKLIRVTSLSMALVFVILVVLINSGLIPFLSFYKATLASGELFYRGEITFFYKGFLFFGIGAIFYYFTETSKWSYLIFTFLVLAIMVSATRGLLLSLGLTFSSYFLLTKSNLKSALWFAFACLIFIWGSALIVAGSRWLDAGQTSKSYHEANPNLLGDRNYSDNGRITQIKEVKQRFSISSAMVGHGFGNGIPSRPIHMEIAYLEILHKQGLIGLAFWASFAASIFRQYRQALPSPSTHAFFFSAVFIFVESFTNQYINNPIGMSMLLLSWVGLNKLRK